MLLGEERAGGWGGSEIGAVCGFSPYETILEAIQRKAGLLPGPEQNWFMRWGHLCEPTIIQELREDTGWEVEANDTSFWHASVPWAFATPDAFVKSQRLIIQCKAPQRKKDEQWGADGSGDVPAWYVIQVLWEMDVMRSLGMGVDRAEMVVRFGTRPIQRFPVAYDAGRVAWIHERAALAWQQVLQLRKQTEAA